MRTIAVVAFAAAMLAGAALVLVATRTTLGRGWRVSVPVALLLLVVYGVPVALLIR